MTIYSQPGSYINSATINDGATISASGIELTNASGGIILGGSVNITSGGSTFVNDSGAEVGVRNSLSWYPNVSVQGSSGDDTIINAGFVFGKVLLGDGNDTFVDRNGQVDSTGWSIYLEGGNDVLRIESPGYYPPALFANGGAGYDTVVLGVTANNSRRAALIDFEQLIVETDGNIDSFSGFDTIILASTQQFPFYNFIGSLNPAADIFLPDGQSFSMPRSQFRSITGSDGGNSVHLWSSGIFYQSSQVLHDIQLAGGNDYFTIEAFYGGINPIIGELIDGGAGQDTFGVVIGDGNGGGGTINLDLSQAVSFEQLAINAQYTHLNSDVTLSNLVGFEAIFAGEKTKLTLSSADLPGATLQGAAGGSVTLGSDVAVESYNAFRIDPVPGSPTETVADTSMSVMFVNSGTVVSSIRFANGFDLYDGRQGTVGGLVDGGAGDDRLLGGFGAENFLGGAGDDTLDGGSCSDTVDGGDGNDRIYWDAADNPANITAGAGIDRLVMKDSSTLPSFNYAAQGFELLEIETNDLGGTQNWSRQSQTYNLALQLVEYATRYDDGSHVAVTLDPGNANATNQVVSYYDTLDRLAQVDQVNDDASRIIFNYDPAGASALSFDIVYYDNLGRLDRWDQNYDNGSRIAIDYDQANGTPLSSGLVYYDDQNRLDRWTQNYDNGSRVVIDYDQGNASALSSSLVYYDSQSRIDLWDQNYDNGSRVVIDYDQASASALSSSLVYYDNQSHLDRWDQNYDDGSRVVIDYDQANASNLANELLYFDTRARIDLWDRNYDDGSRILVDFDQDNTQSWNQHVLTYNAQGTLIGDVFV